MSALRTAFLRAICECPDEDGPRLVYADWLDERGEADRAEFIRLQIGLAAGTVPEDRRAAAEARARELLGRNQAAWWGELPRRPGVTWVAPFVRGFADVVQLRHGKAWREHAAEVFAAAPVSQLWCGGTFTERTGRPIFASPLLGRIAVFFAPPLDLAGAKDLANNPHLVGRLRTLKVHSYHGDGDGVAATLSRAPGLRNLESLTISDVGPVGVAALAGSPDLTHLKALHLNGNPVGDDGAVALAASPHLSALEFLQLNHAGVGDRGVMALARAEHLTSLQTLYLGGGSPITDAGALAIASAAGLPRLAKLHLWGSRIGEAGARALADFAERRGLRTLNLGYPLLDHPIPVALWQELAQRLGPRFGPRSSA
jgi:uncharacterized protein (TIGR02996 family)